MPIVQAKCTNCGGVLAVEDGLEAAVCPFCNTPYIVEKAITNYNITNNVNVGAGAVVNVYGSSQEDFNIEAGNLIKYKGASKDVIIPDTVSRICTDAFRDLDITSVFIPSSVKEIERYAFFGCDYLEKISIESMEAWCSVIIGNSNFSCVWTKDSGYQLYLDNNIVTEIIIPDGFEYISERLFKKCVSIERVKIPNSVKEIGMFAFDGCKNLKSINIPNSVVHIGSYCFKNCNNLKSVKLSNNMNEIHMGLFSYSGLTHIDIPNSITKIWDNAFSNSKLESIVIPESVTSIGDSAFWGCKQLRSITIPDSVTDIGKEDILKECENLEVINASDKIIRKLNHNKENNNNSGCYIATAVYGSYDCPQVWTLRRYRDNQLAKTWYGRIFIHCYYAISPTFVKLFGNTEWFKRFWRTKLDKMVNELLSNGYESTYYEDIEW